MEIFTLPDFPWYFTVSLLVFTAFFSYVFVAPAVWHARKMLKAEAAGESLGIRPVEGFALIIMPIVGYLLLYIMDNLLLDPKSVLSIWFLVALSIGAYFLSRLKKSTAGPLLLALIPSALVLGLVLVIVQLVHFSPIVFLSMAFIIPFTPLAFFCIPAFSLIQAVILFATELIIVLKRIGIRTADLHPSNKFISLFRRFYYGKYSLVAQVLTFPVFITLGLLILMVFGQKPDALLDVFVDSGDGLFSQGRSALESDSDDEYICTIAGFGSPRLVKPIGYGIRNGRAIRVTRQLQICNAFEELLQEQMPSVQRILRKLYDAMQIRIDRWKSVRHVANILYIFIKPMEWCFLVVIYLFDKNPERRIQRQYMPPAYPIAEA